MSGYMAFANGAVKEISDDGNMMAVWAVPGLYDALVLAGYPLNRDDQAKTFDGCLDLIVDGDEVVAFTTGPEPREHRMGTASEVFLAWYRAEHTPESED